MTTHPGSNGQQTDFYENENKIPRLLNNKKILLV